MPAKRIQDEYKNLLTPQARYRARQRAKGLCIACNTPSAGYLCLNHKGKAKEYHKRFKVNRAKKLDPKN